MWIACNWDQDPIRAGTKRDLLRLLPFELPKVRRITAGVYEATSSFGGSGTWFLYRSEALARRDGWEY